MHPNSDGSYYDPEEAAIEARQQLMEERDRLNARIAELEADREFLRKETMEAVAKANRLEEQLIQLVPVRK